MQDNDPFIKVVEADRGCLSQTVNTYHDVALGVDLSSSDHDPYDAASCPAAI
jgi:hypothetical protein